MNDQFDYHFKVYIDKCFALAHTMTIKSEKEASDMNQLVVLRTRQLVDSSTDKRDWIYYRHVSGEYHETDKPIYVISVDTTERIIFNKENLKLHKNTKKEYSYGTHKYEELVEQYPEMELLIKGILNPCDIEYAINAEDGTVLSYDKRFIEMNEYSLMEKLQDFCYGMFSRWYQKQYNIDHRLYNLTFMGILYQKLVEFIIQTRLEMCLTNEAHSYHYRRFLASHGFLDYYVDYLTVKQALILYKNIRWVERYVGQTHTQRWLIKHILTLRNMPIAEYNMVQVYNNIIEDVKSIARFEKKSLNGLELIDPTTDTLNLDQMMDKEDPLAYFNLQVREEEEKKTRELLSESLASELKTKVLESKVIDYSDSEEQILSNILLDQWIDMVDREMYKAYILINHPVSGELVPLSGKNALLLFTLAVMRANDLKDNCIPDFTIGLSIRNRKPTIEELRSYIPDNSIIRDEWLNLLIEEYVPLTPIMNTIDFYRQGEDTFHRINKWLELAEKDEHLDATSYKIASAYRMFSTRIVSFRRPDLTNYDMFLEEIAFDTKGMDRTDWMRMANLIWMKATGLDSVELKSLNSIHQAMIGLMTKLSSYSVHYIREINKSPIIATRFRSLRLNGDGEKKAHHVTDSAGNNFAVEIIDDDTRSIQHVDESNPELNAIRILDREERNRIEFETDPSVVVLSDMSTIRINTDSMVRLGTSVWIEGDDIVGLPNPLSLPSLPGMQSWLDLPNKIKRQITDQFNVDLVWDEHEPNQEPPREPLSWGIRNSDLQGLDYNEKETP